MCANYVEAGGICSLPQNRPDKEKRATPCERNPLSLMQIMARPAGIEPTTPWFVAKYSIQLSYGREERDYNTRKNVWGPDSMKSWQPTPSLLGAIDFMGRLMDLLPQRLALFRRQFGWPPPVIALARLVRTHLLRLAFRRTLWLRPVVATLPGRCGQGQALHNQQ